MTELKDTGFVLGGTPRLYFAFGMNLDPAAMDYPGMEPVGKAVLPGYRLVMRGFADIEPAEGEAVFGGLWRVTPDALRMLDGREGYTENASYGFYDRREVTVETDAGAQRALVYFMKPHAAAGRQFPPSAHYVEMIRRGYRFFGHGPEADAELAEAVEAATPPETFLETFRRCYPGGASTHEEAR